MMPPYPISCTTRDCVRPAVYKIAARWSDGFTQELKTYALCCRECVAEWLRTTAEKRATGRLAPGETLDEPGVYSLERGRRDVGLQRVPELEH